MNLIESRGEDVAVDYFNFPLGAFPFPSIQFDFFPLNVYFILRSCTLKTSALQLNNIVPYYRIWEMQKISF